MRGYRMKPYKTKYDQKIVEKACKLFNDGMLISDIARELKVFRATVQNWIGAMEEGRGFLFPVVKKVAVREEVEQELIVDRIKEEHGTDKKKYNLLKKRHRELEKEHDALLDILDHEPTVHKIEELDVKRSEATSIMLLSDWHVEEVVRSEEVSGLNKHTPAEARKRVELAFQNGLLLHKIMARDVSINTIILGILGDLISGNIHEELLETCAMPPIDASIFATDLLTDGISFLLENSDVKIKAICKSGNHARITRGYRYATEDANSLEYFIYNTIAKIFSNEPRVEIIAEKGYHTYVDIYGIMTRWHHGHRIRYMGGVGGITIPVNKRIAEWNKGRKADLDFLGHFHQRFDGGNFLSNGSTIGTTSYSLGFGYERPQQTFLLLDKKRGKTIVAPILVE
jgi:transposase